MNRNHLKKGFVLAASGSKSSPKVTRIIVATIMLSLAAVITPTQKLVFIIVMAAAFMMVLGAVILALRSIEKFEARQSERLTAK